jgi:hypothetical protein
MAEGSETSSLRTGACSRDMGFDDWHACGWEVPSSCSATHARHVGSVRSIDRSASDGHDITHSPCHHAIPTVLQLHAHPLFSPELPALCSHHIPQIPHEQRAKGEQSKPRVRALLH